MSCSTAVTEIACGNHRASGPSRTLVLRSGWCLSGSSLSTSSHLQRGEVPALCSPALTTVPLPWLPSSPTAISFVLASDPGLGCLNLTVCCVGLLKFFPNQDISTDPDTGVHPLDSSFVTLSERFSLLYFQWGRRVVLPLAFPREERRVR